MWNEGAKTFIAGEALLQNRRVKIESGTTMDPPEVVYADAGEDFIGTTLHDAADGAAVTVKLKTAQGTIEVGVTVGSAIARGTTLYGAADGKMSDTSSGSAQGVAMEAGVDGADIEVCLYNVKSTTAATVSVADSGGFTDAATVEAALAEIYQHLLSAQKVMPIPLTAFTQEDGTALTKQATTVAGFAQLANKEVVLDIPVDCTAGETLQASIPVPQDLDDSADIVVHVLAGKAADLDVLTLDCEVYPCAAGDTANADIQDTAAQTITQAASELTFTCGADGVLAAPGTLTVVLALGGTNDGDAVYIYGAWIEYTAQVLTA